MRWYLIDRFLEFERGRRAVAVKNVTAAEEAVDEYFPGASIYPPSLIIEGLAQTGGLLVGEADQWRRHVVLAKVARARFHRLVAAGDTLVFETRVQDFRSGGAVVQGSARIGQELAAEAELMFAQLDDRFEQNLFAPADFLRMLRVLGVYDVGRDSDGRPLTPPEHLAAAEAAQLGDAP